VGLSTAVSLCISACLLAVVVAGETPEIYVREESAVAVRGVEELWQLVWIGKPSEVCGPDKIDEAITCPCAGFAYGEYGDLWLIRMRGGKEVERMDLGSIFARSEYPQASAGHGTGSVQRWPMQYNDFERYSHGDPNLQAEIRQRPLVPVMRFADYNHDGNATKFLLQVGTLPCAKQQFAAIGVSKDNPQLHALSSAELPNVPLIMSADAWFALLPGRAPQSIVTSECADHGGDTRRELVVSGSGGVIHVTERQTRC
jgi:hypothetical protein